MELLQWSLDSVRPKNAPPPRKILSSLPGFGYSITPVPKFPDRPGRENRVHFSYASARGKTARSATTAQILGYAMAHELGHLLSLDAHSDLGIMSVA